MNEETTTAETTTPPSPGPTVKLGFEGISVSPGDHLAHFYQTPEEARDLRTSYLATGLQLGDRCLFMVADDEEAERLVADLEARGRDVASALEAGQLSLDRGRSSPRELRELLQTTLEEVGTEDSFLRWGGDMTWALDRMELSRDLLRWETACNLEATRDVVYFCQYSLRDFPGSVVLDALRTHPLCIIGRSVQQNSLYEDPGEFLQELENRPETARASS